MGNGEGSDLDISNREAGSGLHELDRRREFLPVKRGVGTRIAIEGQGRAPLALLMLEQRMESAHMVTVFVAQHDGADFRGINRNLRQALVEFAAADAGIEEDTGTAGRDQGGIARAPASQNGDAENENPSP